jgi:hypothetical protein
MNKVFYFGPDTKYGAKDTFEIITPSLSKISINRLEMLGWQIIHIETTEDGHKLSILAERRVTAAVKA